VYVSSTFDTDLDGWVGLDGSFSYQSSGGNPGGYIQFYDSAGTGFISAPAKFLGDWQPRVATGQWGSAAGTAYYTARVFSCGW
jgi:hypothetical protein